MGACAASVSLEDQGSSGSSTGGNVTASSGTSTTGTGGVNGTGGVVNGTGGIGGVSGSAGMSSSGGLGGAAGMGGASGMGGSAGMGGVVCDPGWTECDGNCFNMQVDPEHCGSCDITCPPDGHCINGACVTQGCFTDCGWSCSDLQQDRDNCGGCGVACGQNQICQNGACTACPGGQLGCESGCLDGSADAQNCGYCGRACTPGQTCVDGECTGTCADDALEDNDTSGAAKQVAWSGVNLMSASLNMTGYLCSGDEDWFLLDTASLNLMDPVFSLEARAKGSAVPPCVCGCDDGVCYKPWAMAGPQNTITVEIYNAATNELLATGTEPHGNVEIGAYGPALSQGLLVHVKGPAAAQYPYQLWISIYENNGEEAECEC